MPDRLRLARLLAWAIPTLVLWGMNAVYDTRLLAPAWPPLVLLVVWTLLPAFAGAQKRSEWLVAVPTAAMLVLVVLAAYNINGLESSGWQQFRSVGLSGLTDAVRMRNIALGGDFSAEIDALAPQVGPHDRILTYDGRLEFFYLDQVDLAAPQSCSQLAGHRLFVLLEDDETQKLFGRRDDASFWEACRNVTLTKVAERPGAFAVFVNGAPRSASSGCGAPTQTDQGLAIEFGRVKTAAQALALQKHVVAPRIRPGEGRATRLLALPRRRDGGPQRAGRKVDHRRGEERQDHGDARQSLRRAVSASPPPPPTSTARRDART